MLCLIPSTASPAKRSSSSIYLTTTERAFLSASEYDVYKFVSSGSAKAFLVMPILLPLADLVGVTRQVAVTAYCFGDGFSNLAYPANPVLWICLGLTAVSYVKWLQWTLKNCREGRFRGVRCFAAHTPKSGHQLLSDGF